MAGLVALAVSLPLASSASAAGEWAVNVKAGGYAVEPYANEYMSEITGVSEWAETCIGPAQWTGSGFNFPYGWLCGGQGVKWGFSPLSAKAAVLNVNTHSESYLLFWS